MPVYQVDGGLPFGRDPQGIPQLIDQRARNVGAAGDRQQAYQQRGQDDGELGAPHHGLHVIDHLLKHPGLSHDAAEDPDEDYGDGQGHRRLIPEEYPEGVGKALKALAVDQDHKYRAGRQGDLRLLLQKYQSQKRGDNDKELDYDGDLHLASEPGKAPGGPSCLLIRIVFGKFSVHVETADLEIDPAL